VSQGDGGENNEGRTSWFGGSSRKKEKEGEKNERRKENALSEGKSEKQGFGTPRSFERFGATPRGEKPVGG